jgi:asparagine synthetase B (glutamine-hydrolysing)
MADVPFGMFLSGGIDSAAITAVMSQLVDDQVKTFSVAFAEREANELRYARLVAERYRTDHHEITVTPDAFFAALPSLVWHEDEPLAHPSSVALNFVSRLAAERVKVVLTGEGSDETLAGYNRYRATILQMAAGSRYEGVVPAPLRAAVRAAAGALPAGARPAEARPHDPHPSGRRSTRSTSRTSPCSRAPSSPGSSRARRARASATPTRTPRTTRRSRAPTRARCSTGCSTPTPRRTCTSC